MQRYRELAGDLALVMLGLSMPHMDGRQALSDIEAAGSVGAMSGRIRRCHERPDPSMP